MGKIAFFDDDDDADSDFYTAFSIVLQRIEIWMVFSDIHYMMMRRIRIRCDAVFYIHNYFTMASYSTAVFNPLNAMVEVGFAQSFLICTLNYFRKKINGKWILSISLHLKFNFAHVYTIAFDLELEFFYWIVGHRKWERCAVLDIFHFFFFSIFFI